MNEPALDRLDSVVVSYRQMHGSAPARRTFHRPTCALLKNRTTNAPQPDTVLTRKDAEAAGYKACTRCNP
jgi:hypothetical protein